MARISDRDIERLKKDLPLVTLLQQQGFDLQKQGKDYVTRCPFHNDKTPSLVISPDKNLWNCLGACGTGGSVIDWMMQLEKVGFRKAVDLLMAQFSSLAASPLVAPCQEALVNPLPGEETQGLLSRVIAHYQDRLSQSAAAQSYLKKRGLDNAELIETFKLGYCDRKINIALASRNSAQGKEERTCLKSTGILLDSGIERFGGSLVVPVLNDGQLLEAYGRKIGSRLSKDAQVHNYLPGKHAGIWNLDGIKGQAEIILCESLIDAMTLWAHGFRNVTASYGTNGFTEELHAFIQANTKTVFIAYDRDEAGDHTAHKLIEVLAQSKINAVRLALPPGMDINEWALQEQAFNEVFSECLFKARASLSSVVAQESSVNTNVNTPINKGVIEFVRGGDDLHVELGARQYRVRGLAKNKHREQLKINLLLRHGDEFFIDAVDMYQAKQRQSFIKQASVECGVENDIVKADLGKLLLALEHEIDHALEEKTDKKSAELTDAETKAALDYLKDPSLLSRLVNDVNACGLVGEDTNALVGYLACVSRKLDKPLAVIIQSTSAAGKSSLMDAVLNFMPKEERVQYSAMTGQALYYLGETDVKHKILAIAEEEGASNASYALKLLQSEGEITIASTGKDESTGDLMTKEYTVEGPVMLFMTTTAIDIDEELLNRCLVLTVNESQEQTEAIHAQQRFNDTLEGLLAKENKSVLLDLHHNVQRLLKPLHVVNPFANQLTFLSHKTRTRRDHQKYLTLIKSIALLHQYQREIKKIVQGDVVTEYIEVIEQDIAHANELAHEVLGRTLDELPPQTRKLLTFINDYVNKRSEEETLARQDLRFSRRELRELTGWGLTQIAVHCQRLEEMEYLIAHSGQRGKIMRYQLCYDDQGQPLGLTLRDNILLDVHVHVDAELSGQKGGLSGSNRPQIGGVSAPNRPPQNGSQPRCDKTLELLEGAQPEKRIVLDKKTPPALQPSA